MEISQHISAIQRDGELMAAAARRAGLDAAVPSCASWQVRDLLRHQGYVHRWATGYVAHEHQERVPRLSEAEHLAAGSDDPQLLDWFAAGHQALVDSLSSADPDLKCWTFLAAPSPLAFWARRQAHETAIHRVDAELAAGDPSLFPADFAADGIDELIIGFFGRGQAGAVQCRTLGVAATDAGTGWLVTLTPDGSGVAGVQRGGGNADCTVSGPAAALYLLLWNRASVADGDVRVEGDADLLKSWPQGMPITWG